MRRAYTFDGALAVADHYAIAQDDVLLHLLPVHHATGLGIMFFPFLISGALIEFRSGSFSRNGPGHAGVKVASHSSQVYQQSTCG